MFACVYACVRACVPVRPCVCVCVNARLELCRKHTDGGEESYEGGGGGRGEEMLEGALAECTNNRGGSGLGVYVGGGGVGVRV